MPIASDITALVGRTPLVRLNRLPQAFGCKAEILAKLESFNPTASVISLPEPWWRPPSVTAPSNQAERCWWNPPVATRALLGHGGCARGYRLILTMPDTMSMERRSMSPYAELAPLRQ